MRIEELQEKRASKKSFIIIANRQATIVRDEKYKIEDVCSNIIN